MKEKYNQLKQIVEKQEEALKRAEELQGHSNPVAKVAIKTAMREYTELYAEAETLREELGWRLLRFVREEAKQKEE